jgi:hypothetical protein
MPAFGHDDFFHAQTIRFINDPLRNFSGALRIGQEDPIIGGFKDEVVLSA